MPMSKAERLVALGVPTQQAQEIQDSIADSAVKTQPAFANIGAAPTQVDFNNLLATLRNAGVIAR